MQARGLIVFSESMDPYLNMGIEQWLYETLTPERVILFLWKNSDSIIIGRFQNPWAECEVPEALRAGIPVLRRISGGGTVFHDSGNLNFSIITPRGHYDQGRSFAVVLKALKSFGLSPVIRNKSDIVIDGKKVSGNAFKVGSDRAMHHGTLLINSDLPRLKRFLTPCIVPFVSKAIQSRPSPVINLCDGRPELEMTEVRNKLRQCFTEEYSPEGTGELRITADTALTYEDIALSAERFKNWSWVFGKTPFFEFVADKCKVSVEEGLVTRVLDDNGRLLSAEFVGRRLDMDTLSAIRRGAREGSALPRGFDYV